MIANIAFTLLYMWAFDLKLTGVLLGTITSTILTVTWQDPYIIFHHAFHSNVRSYFNKYFYNLLIVAIECGIIIAIEPLLPTNIILHLISLLMLIGIVSIVIPFICYLGKDELRYSLGIVERIGAKIAN